MKATSAVAQTEQKYGVNGAKSQEVMEAFKDTYLKCKVQTLQCALWTVPMLKIKHRK